MPPDTPDSTLDFARLNTPPGHGDVLIEPAAGRWVELARANHAHLSAMACPILDLTGAEVRAMTRRAAGLDPSGRVIASGHEPEFVHPGVLAKHVMAQRLAEALGGTAVNVIVDHDAPKRAAFEVPSLIDGRPVVRTVSYGDSPGGRAYELFPPMSADGWAGFERELRAVLGDRFDRSLLPLFLGGARGQSHTQDWVEQWAAGRRAVEAAIGIRIHDRRTSRLWVGPLLAEMVVNAPRLAAAYNAALDRHRREHRIRSPLRPVPNLAVDGDVVEVPAWVYRRGETRRRLFVRFLANSVELLTDRASCGVISRRVLAHWETAGPALAALDGFMFRPRALMLTLWARLFLADLFIHGIGGAKYDCITDGIIRDYFGVAPPAMTCVSATLLLDLPRHVLPPNALHAEQHRWRDLHFNPQRFVPSTGDRASLLRLREEAIARSEALRVERPKDRPARRVAFEAIRAINRGVVAKSPEVVSRLLQALDTTLRHAADNAVSDRRDFFFGLYTPTSLGLLMDQLPHLESAR